MCVRVGVTSLPMAEYSSLLIHSCHIWCPSHLDGMKGALIILFSFVILYCVVPQMPLLPAECLGSLFKVESRAPPPEILLHSVHSEAWEADCWQASRGLSDFEPIWFGRQVRLQALHAYFSMSSSACTYFICVLFCQKLVWIQIFSTLTRIGKLFI